MKTTTHCTVQLAKLLLAASVTQALPSANIIQDADQHVFGSVPGSHGAVASEAKECTAIGRDLLAQGGNAVDALVGTTFCVGTVGMYHSGIGGGGFALIKDAEGNYEAIDFRESAPAAAFEDMYEGNVNGSIRGGLAAGVPGEVRGLEYIHQKYGRMPWKTVMSGAIDVARNGFRVSADLMHFMEGRDFLVDDPVFAEEFAPNGTLLQLDDVMIRSRYANTLERIAEEGSEAFYSGELAESMIDVIQKTNGTMTLKDLQNYEVKTRKVIKTRFRGVDVHGIPSPASGAVSLSHLKTVDQYPADGWHKDRHLSVHRYVEAMKFAYGARLELGDPEFVDGVETLEDRMVDPKYAEEITRRILDDSTQKVDKYDPKKIYTTEGEGTSHIVTADGSGMATSLTTTVNLIFGAEIMDPVSGVIINNEMNDFSIPGVPNEFGFAPSEANFIRPHKRPLSSCTPLIVADADGTLLATVGAAGGSRIISATTLVVDLISDPHVDMEMALQSPRVHHQLMPDELLVERSLPDDIVADLESRGHNVRWMAEGVSAVQGISRQRGGAFLAVAEPRQNNSGALTL